MKVNVITDDSIEGSKIKKALENKNLEASLDNSYVIRWGNWLSGNIHDADSIIYNSPFSIKNTLDKENVLLTLQKNHVRCPKRIKPGKKTNFPILGRLYNHENGTDIRIIDTLNEYKKCDREYFVQYLKIVKEYRVHVMDLSIFFIEEKYLKEHHVYKIDKTTSNTNKKNRVSAPKLTKDYTDLVKENSLNEDLVIRNKAFGWEYKKIDLDDLDVEGKQDISNLVQSAIYCLGLDFGVANIGLSAEGKYYILDVDATCTNLSTACLEAYMFQFVKLLQRYDNIKNNPQNITIGADPECLLKDKETNNLVFASDFFTKEGSLGLDARSIEAGRQYFPIVEVRPKYSTNPVDVSHSIKSILGVAGKYISYKNIGLYSGSMPLYDYWLGGHIHFGVKPNKKFISALDNYLALLIMMIVKPASARQRNSRYGKLGNYRLKSHGGFEYCTLSSWLVNPELATSILCLSKVIAQEYLNLKEEFLCTYSDIRAYYLVSKLYFKDKIPKIINNLSQTATFKKYANYIQPLFNDVLQCKEWDEDSDIKKQWGLPSSKDNYVSSSFCYMPTKKRKELGLKIGDMIYVNIGKQEFQLKIYPKDDQSVEKNGYVSFSKDICEKIGLNEKDSLNIWFDSQNNIYKVGTILGIFADETEHPLGPFGNQSYYFRKLIKLSKDKGILTYVFNIYNVNVKNHKLMGYTYDFENNQWLTNSFPIPQVVYDRGDVISQSIYGNYAPNYLNFIKKNNIKFINNLDCINLTNNKWATSKLLLSNEKTKKYQPDTFEYTTNEQLLELLNKYNHIFIKLKKGSRSKGIFSIEKIEEDYCKIMYKNSSENNVKTRIEINDLPQFMKDQIRKWNCEKSDYIIQRAIPLAKYHDSNFEIRVVMQKNSSGIWHRTCMIARCASGNDKFLNPIKELDKKSSKVLLGAFEDNAELVRKKLIHASREVSSLLNEVDISVGEFAIDFGVDKDMNVYIIELNSKPDNLLSLIGAFKTRNLAACRILEYAKFLTAKQ